MILVITGSRDYAHLENIQKELLKIKQITINLKIFVGTARGVDKKVIQICKENHIFCETFKPKWEIYGKFAGKKRSLDMILDAKQQDDHVEGLAFWDGMSNGTKFTIEKFKELKIKYQIIYDVI